MKGWDMYSRIQRMKEQGFSIRQCARIIRVSRTTITKYWDMPPEEYAAALTAVNKVSALAAYEEIIVHWLQTYPCMSAAQVRDWLEEWYHLDTAERTARRFVAGLREKYSLSKQTEPQRDYEAVDELPKGYQLQLDFGVKSVRCADSSRYIKLYVAAFSLSHSRYKWGTFQDHPFTAADLVKALYGCFAYMCGMPRQLVYDQDSIIVVSENSGDIIHTQAFASFLQQEKLDAFACRKADPESKGKIENVVKFIKGNFMENRLYMGLSIWNRSFEDWLDRTGNGKVHGTTKRKPVDMFQEEQPHLLPLLGIAPTPDEPDMERTVRKDNTIIYLSNRYSVPLGTYHKGEKVTLEIIEHTLKIRNGIGEEIACHAICADKGKLIKASSHRRETSQKVQERLLKVVSQIEHFRNQNQRIN